MSCARLPGDAPGAILIDYHCRGYHLSFDHWSHEDLMSSTIKVGVAGWSYKDWQGIVYPESLNAKSRV